jgi:serine/threonine protein kinase
MFFWKLSNSLNILHHFDIIHKNISGESVLINKEKNPIITNISFNITNDDDFDENRFKAPELQENNNYYTKETDIFSLGVLYFEFFNDNKFERYSFFF